MRFGDERERTKACRALGRLGRSDRRAPADAGDGGRGRGSCARRPRRRSAPVPRAAAVSPLARALADQNWWVRANSASSLRRCGAGGARRAAPRGSRASRSLCPRPGARGAGARGGKHPRTRSPHDRLRCCATRSSGFNFLMLVYFAALNVIYTVLLVLGWRAVSTYVRRRRLMDIDEIARSELTMPISMVVPAYNEGPVIVDSVRALLGARYPTLEVVVVNDGSTDDTLRRADRRVLARARDARAGRAAPDGRIQRDPRLPGRRPAGRHRQAQRRQGRRDQRGPPLRPLSAHLHDGRRHAGRGGRLPAARAPFQAQPETVACGGIVRVANGCTVQGGASWTCGCRGGCSRTSRSWSTCVRSWRGAPAGPARRPARHLGRVRPLPPRHRRRGRRLRHDDGRRGHGARRAPAPLLPRPRQALSRRLPRRAGLLDRGPGRSASLCRQRNRWHRGLRRDVGRHRGMSSARATASSAWSRCRTSCSSRRSAR